jgi:uncharacterized protein (DUF983 family)
MEDTAAAAARQLQHQRQHCTQAKAVIRLCPRCQGHRTEKQLYNSFMVLERSCGACDGLGVVPDAPDAATSA